MAESNPKKVEISKYALESALLASKNVFPREFIGLLRQNAEGALTELVIAPFSEYGIDTSSFQQWQLPLDRSLAASFHSHPGYSNRPSEQDLRFFSRTYKLHFIAKLPFSPSCVACYDNNGRPLQFKII